MKKSAVVLILNSNNELALQKRSAIDASHPSCWDFSAGGGVDAGEDFQTAAIRELKEELGVDAQVIFITEMNYPGTGYQDAEVIQIFKTIYNGPFLPDPQEVEEVKFFSLEEIAGLIRDQKRKFHPEFLFFFENYSMQIKMLPCNHGTNISR
jgi:isopentenyldiphosphate isomerase